MPFDNLEVAQDSGNRYTETRRADPMSPNLIGFRPKSTPSINRLDRLP